ncbi:MAG: BatD family protein [Planctomycetota bacterium]
MSKSLLSLVGIWLALLPLAKSEDIVVRTDITPEKTASIGSRVILTCDVLAKDAWAKLPSLPNIDVSGAIVYTPPSQSTRLTETIKGGSYTGQRYEWWIYPQRAGDLTIPSVELNVARTIFGDSDPLPVAKRSTKSLSLEIQPLSKEAAGASIVSSSLRIKQTWGDLPNEIHVGDGVNLTIESEIKDAPAFVLPPIDFGNPESVRILTKQPSTENRFNRGELTGSRVDKATYFFEKPGKVVLPPIEIKWWDNEKDELREEKLDGETLNILPALDSLNMETKSTATRVFQWRLSLLLPVAFAFMILGYAFFRNRLRLEAWLNDYVQNVTRTETVAFRHFVFIASTGDAAEILRALTHWSDLVQEESKVPQIGSLIRTHGDQSTQLAIDQLMDCVATGKRFDASKLVDGFRKIQKAIHRRRIGDSRWSSFALGRSLPPLRPNAKGR